MLLKCPHCSQTKEYSEAEYRRIFIACKACSREFRAAECSPLTGREPRDRVEILEMGTVETVPGQTPEVLTGAGDRPRRKFLQRLFGKSD
jgi:hypothetical protein